MIEQAIVKIVDKQDLTYDEAYEVISEIMSGKTTATQNAAFLAALSTKSTKAETTEEIAGCAAAMRDAAVKFENDDDLLEIVGTGGDNAHSFNISTTSAMVIASAGVKVAKHGNRAASSLSGTADCLEALGINIDMSRNARRDELLLLLRAEVSHIDEVRRTYPQGARNPHRIQYPRTSHQPRKPEALPARRI